MNMKCPRLKHWQFTCLCMTLVIIDQQMQYEQFCAVLEIMWVLDAFTVIMYLQLKSELKEKKIQDPVHKMSCPLLCLKNKANILLLIHVHQACMQLLPLYNVCIAYFQHPSGVCLLFFVCDFSAK